MDVPLEATVRQMADSAPSEIVAVYLFGSRARGTAGLSSDVDLAVLLRSCPGILVLDRDRPARIRFEVQSRNEYFDLAPLRRLYRRLPA